MKPNDRTTPNAVKPSRGEGGGGRVGVKGSLGDMRKCAYHLRQTLGFESVEKSAMTIRWSLASCLRASVGISTSTSSFTPSAPSFSHLNESNYTPKMVNITHKVPMRRKAHAQCKVMLPPEGTAHIRSITNILANLRFTLMHPLYPRST